MGVVFNQPMSTSTGFQIPIVPVQATFLPAVAHNGLDLAYQPELVNRLVDH
jgi:hypothetical protein